MANTIESRADLHAHANGQYAEALLKEAQENNVTVLGALEHTTILVDQAKSLITRGQKLGITILPGIEVLIRAIYGNQEFLFELIGLGFDLDNRKIYDELDSRGSVYSKIHAEKVQFQKAFLEANFGLNLTPTVETAQEWEGINSKIHGDTAIRLCRAAVNSPLNIARIEEIKKEHAAEIAAHNLWRPEDQGKLPAFLYWQNFAADQPGFRRWGKPTEPADFVHLVHSAGGVVVVAHPDEPREEVPIPDNFLDYLLDNIGVDGLEGWNAGPLDEYLAQKARSRGKLVLGGSGKSYPNYVNRVIGMGDVDKKDMFIPASIADEIESYKQKSGIKSVLLHL